AEKAAAENSQQNSREVSNAGAAAGQQSEPPIIDTGARADLLATMLDQPTPSQLDQPGTVHAKPVDANGAQLPNDGNQIPWLINSQIREPGLSGAARGHAGNYAPAVGEYTYISYNGGAYKLGNTGEADFNSGVNQVIQHVVIKNDHENKTLTLPANLIVSEKGKNLTYKAPGGSKKIKFVNYITMNTALIQWNSDNGSNWVQLVIRKNGEQQADLCWIYHLPDTERMYCSRWGIPSNWSYGQALNYAGNYLSDKQRYWATDNIGSVNF
ncbi:MAG: hypothetical protein Q4B13_11350, partial [Lautropia sp.]|nr:hypothetical protein [Lautropia sp.]